jgi:GTP-binding protein
MEDINVGETVCPVEHQEALPILRIDEPTLQMTFAVNNSPFAGREGKFVTSRKIEERLLSQLQTDVSLRVDPTASPDAWIVSGRGELHLSILIENMRREGYELQVSKPEVIIKEIDGVKCEPVERVQIDVPEEHTGGVMESIGARKGEMIDMINNGNGQVRLIFNVPARGLIGYSTEFMSLTRGFGIINHTFDSYQPMQKGQVGGRRQGVLVSMENGKSTTYGIQGVEDRGIIFIEAGVDVYEGMIVGEHTRENDLVVNICKMKQQTNIRSANKDQTNTMKKPRIMSLEEALEYLNEDEYCELTPESIRLRKKILDKNEREKSAKKKKIATN